MPGGVILLQRLADLDGRPTVLAKAAACVLAAGAATVAFAAGPDGGGQEAPGAAPVSAGRLVGELPLIAPARTPTLGKAAALPPLRRGGSRRRTARATAVTAPLAPTPEPETTATPTPTPPPTPPASSEPAAPVVAPAPAPVRPAPTPRATPVPDETFDSSG